MASTYSNLKIELMGTGDQSGTWGTTTNTNLGTAIEEAITGTADVSFSSADVTLTLSNTNTAQTARNLRLNLTGTVGAAQNLIVPSIEKQYIINNTLGYAITVKNSTGTGVAVPAGKSMIVFNTGSNVVEVVTALATGTVIPVANGGTGASTATITSFNNITGYTASGATGTTSSNLVFAASPTLTGTPLAPTAAPGTSTTQIASTAFVGAAVTAATGSLGTMSTQNANAVAITGGTITGITDLAVADGGTGASTLSANAVLLGNGTSALQTVAPSTSGNVLTSNGTTWTSSAPSSISTGAGTLTASGQTFTITTGSQGKCLINLSASYVAAFANWGSATANLVIAGSTVASDSAYYAEFSSRVSGDHAIIAYQYSGSANSSVTVTFTTTFNGTFNKAFYSFIGS
jgi:hypothetical protein